MSMPIDLNADLGEGTGNDPVLMTIITSANISCGAHAGSEMISREAIRLAGKHNVRVGAHPGYPAHGPNGTNPFGRMEQVVTTDSVVSLVRQQVLDFIRWAEIEGQRVQYIKPHGALYNQAMREGHIAAGIVQVALELGLPLMGLPRSRLEQRSREAGIPYIREGFADRRYRSDGTLVPRSEPNSIIHDVHDAITQVELLIQTHGIETICIHGDNPASISLATHLRDHLQNRS